MYKKIVRVKLLQENFFDNANSELTTVFSCIYFTLSLSYKAPLKAVGRPQRGANV